jgi:tRNA (guanine-N7-)-methyltransferase
MSLAAQTAFRIRSFVIRGGTGTPAQTRALRELWPQFGLTVQQGRLNFVELFGREAPTYLEIGFGTGHTLVAAAEQYPEKNFIGVETHKPGIGSLLLGVAEKGLTNLRVIQGDVVDVLKECIAPQSLAGIQIFFPDPWQKRRHHPRRLIQPAFMETLAAVLQDRGSLHLATDWEDYAKHMLSVVNQAAQFENLAGAGHFGQRSPYRPVISKFEKRALSEGRVIREFQLVKK